MTSTNHSISTVELVRHQFLSSRTFDDTLTGLHAKLGRPDLRTFLQEAEASTDWTTYGGVVDANSGSSGLLVFLELDVGSVISRDPHAMPYRAVRIIAGNPVTMESMARSTPAVGALAPVTVFLFEDAVGVHVRYDTVTSALGIDVESVAAEIANRLDSEVLVMIDSACN